MKQILPFLCLILFFLFWAGCKSKVDRVSGSSNNTSATTAVKSGDGSGTATNSEDRFKESEIQVMWVAPYTKRCVGVAEMDCMLVSFNKARPAQGEWELFYDGIEGFDYEKGNLYQLKVKVGTLKEQFIMADAGSKEYILIEVLRKDGA